MHREKTIWPALALVAVLVSTGCATKKYVRGEMETVEGRVTQRIEGVETQVEEAQTRLDQQEDQIAEASTTAQEALERALEAGKLAEGKFLYEVVLSSDDLLFDFDRAAITDQAQVALDAFASELRSRNENVFIEIQGHTDSTGSDEYNYTLGEERAAAVRRYLSKEHGVALHRISVISYGESAPIADNGTRDGRAQNRRVSLVVLK